MSYLRRIRTTLAIHANRKVSGLLDGQYASMLTGRSLDFSDLRDYVIGDDVKDLDWKATARHSRPLVRRYVADRKHTLMVAIATGSSMAAHAQVTERKSEVALACAGLLAYLGLKHGDYVGACLTIGGESEAWRPSLREAEVERMLRRADELCTLTSPACDLGALLSFLIGTTRRRQILLLITDDVVPDSQQASLLGRLAVQHEILWVAIADLTPGEDETRGQTLLQLDSGAALPDFVAGDAVLRAEIQAAAAQRREQRAALSARLGIAHELVGSGAAVFASVVRLLERGRHAAAR